MGTQLISILNKKKFNVISKLLITVILPCTNLNHHLLIILML